MNKNQKIFRVLVVDDKRPVLQAIEDWTEQYVSVSEQVYKIELLKLHVEIIDSNDNKYKISEETIKQLSEFCDKPFQLMLLDFGYVKDGLKAIDEIYRLHDIDKTKSIRKLVDEVILNPTHLVQQSLTNENYHNRIEKYFINHKGKLIIYTYIPGKIESDYTCADVRKNVTNKHFLNAEIQVIDARKELFNNSKFDNVYTNEKEYYPFLISKYLSKVIHIQIAESLLNNTEQIRNNFKFLKKNNRIINISTILTSLVAGIFIPSLVSSIEKNDYKIAFGFFVVLLSTIIIFTIGPKFLEKHMHR